LLIDRDGAGLPVVRAAEVINPPLNFTVEEHDDPALADKPFLLAKRHASSKIVLASIVASSDCCGRDAHA
jgi:hypothetical protein